MTDLPRPEVRLGGADPELDQLLSDHLNAFNRAATPEIEPARELTVRATDEGGELVGGISGWTWGEAAGMELVWVHAEHRGSGTGAELVAGFEREVAARGCRRIFVSSFTFQAPGFYERLGYHEFTRLEHLPTQGRADVYLRKDL